MHTLVNHLTIKPDADWTDMARRIDALVETIRADHPEVLQLQLVRMGDEAATMIASFTDGDAMADFSSSVAGPWFGENFRQFLGGPADRRIGETVAGFIR